MILKTLIIFFFLQLSWADVEVRMAEIETQVKELHDDVKFLSQSLQQLETTVVNRNIADQKLDKVIANILLNNQAKAAYNWKEVTKHIDQSLVDSYLKTLVEGTYLGSSENFYYLLRFLARHELFTGFAMLYKELEQHHELHSGQEIFTLASTIRARCGSKNELYTAMPTVVQTILNGPFVLKNVENSGYFAVGANSSSCDENSGCYRNRVTQVFVDRFLETPSIDDLKLMKRLQWELEAPENITSLAKGFYMKSLENNLYFVFSQRPPQGLLKSNTTIKPYFSQDMVSQFMPALVPDVELGENLIRLGIQDKFSKKVNYFYGGEFGKKSTRIDLARRQMFKEVEGFVWQVIPVDSGHLDNMIEGGDMNEKCLLMM